MVDRINKLLLELIHKTHKTERKRYYEKDVLAIKLYRQVRRRGLNYSIETILRRLRMLERQGYLYRFYRGKVPNRRAYYMIMWKKVELKLRALEPRG